MKKRFILFTFLIIADIVCAQSFNAGLRFGIDGSQVNGDRLSGFDKAGIICGGYVSRKFSDLISLQMEIVFIQKGSREPLTDQNTFYRLRVHYIEVPVLVKFHVSKTIDLTVGPSFGSLVFSQEDNELGVIESPYPFEKFELSGNFGIIYKMSDHWFFDGRYSNSLTTIRPFPGATLDYFDKGQYNVVIEFSLLYQF